jgi:arylsulfatase A-like enzyme
VTDAALRWLGERKDQRFFLFVHYYDVHYDYIPPPPYNTMFDPDYRGSVTAVNFIEDDAINRRMPARDLEHILALYDGEIRWVDDHIARLLHALEESGAAPRTAVIVTSDHGDEFFEHGDKGHKRTLYREIIQVPLVMRVPGMAAGQVIETPVSLVDLAPTILDLLAVPAPPGLSGQSLVPALAGARLSERDGLYAWFCWREKANCKTMQHATAGTLIHTFQPARLEYYAAADRAQRQNLVRRGAWPRERLTTLAERLDAQWALYRQGSGTQDSLSIDPATREHLRQLGYGD